jgi:TrmH family RNA methyltransferase
MLSNNQIKYINSLKIKKYRQKHAAFLVEGEKNVAELIASNLEIERIFAENNWIEENQILLQSKNISSQSITDIELKRISELVTPNRVIAVVKLPESKDQNNFSGLTLALDGIRDPGNLGTMVRTADWFGIKNIVCSPDCVDFYGSKVIQATMGSFARVNVHYVSLEWYFSELKPEIPVYGALLDAPMLHDQQIIAEGVILIGSESHGISEKLKPFINTPVYISHFLHNQQTNSAESLNASVANGIICYEICKQLYKNNF